MGMMPLVLLCSPSHGGNLQGAGHHLDKDGDAIVWTLPIFRNSGLFEGGPGGLLGRGAQYGLLGGQSALRTRGQRGWARSQSSPMGRWTLVLVDICVLSGGLLWTAVESRWELRQSAALLCTLATIFFKAGESLFGPVQFLAIFGDYFPTPFQVSTVDCGLARLILLLGRTVDNVGRVLRGAGL